MITTLLFLALMTTVSPFGDHVSRSISGGSECNVVFHHNKLDDVESASEIETILRSIDTNYDRLKVHDAPSFVNRDSDDPDIYFKRMADSLKVQPWTKADFDGNGYTDLLVIVGLGSKAVLCIMDSGSDHYSVKWLSGKHWFEFTFPRVVTINNRPMILYYSRTAQQRESPVAERAVVIDTLVFEYGGFIEFNSSPVRHRIEKIDYSAGPCFGGCPVFSMSILSDRSAMYQAEQNDTRTGEFTTTIDTLHYRHLVDLLNYIDFTSLDSNYSVDWTDSQTSTLIITYDHGQIKRIKDYGKIGTYGLSNVYRSLFKLRESQDWK